MDLIGRIQSGRMNGIASEMKLAIQEKGGSMRGKKLCVGDLLYFMADSACVRIYCDCYHEEKQLYYGEVKSVPEDLHHLVICCIIPSSRPVNGYAKHHLALYIVTN